MNPCPGSCNRHYRNAQNDDSLTPEERDAVVAHLGEPVWCNTCHTSIRHALHAIPTLYARLELDKAKATKNAGEKLGKHGKGAAAPSPSVYSDEQDALVRLLTYWEDAIREARDLSVRPARLAAGLDRWPVSWCRLIHGPAREGEQWPLVDVVTVSLEQTRTGPAASEIATLNGAVTFLNAHIDWALKHEGHALELGRDLIRATARVRQMTKTHAQRRRMPLPCPRCELRALVHEGGTEHMTCGNARCGRILSLDEYDQLATALARSKMTGKAHV